MARRRDPRWRALPKTCRRQSLWIRQARLWRDLLPEPSIIDGPFQLLTTARKLFIYSWHDCDLMMVAVLVANQAVEAAFRTLYPEPGKPSSFQALIDRASAQSLISAGQQEVAHDIRELRNLLSHPLGQASGDVLATVNLLGFAHEIVAAIMKAAERSWLPATA